MSSLTAITGSESKFNIEATWIIDAATIHRNRSFKSEYKTIKGMPDVKWWLKCYPEDPQHHGYIGVYLNVQCDNTRTYLVDNVANRTCLGHEKRPAKAFSKSIRRGTITSGQDVYHLHKLIGCINYMPDGNQIKATVKAHFLCTKEKVFLAPNAGSNFGLRLKESDTADFNIIVGNHTIPVHKCFLSTESPVFERMFESDFIEKINKQVTIIDFQYEVVQAAVDYCYAQDISAFFEDDNNIIQLLMFADKYDFQTLKPALEKCLWTKVTEENVALYATAADESNSFKLQDDCNHFIASS